MEDYQQLLAEGKNEELIRLLGKKENCEYSEQLSLGSAYFNLGMYLNAEMEFKELYNTDQDNPVLIYMLGNIYLKMGRRDKAIYFYEKASRYESVSEDAKLRLAELGNVKELDEETEKIKEIRGFRSDIKFSDVKGMEKQKQYLREHLIFLLKQPELAKKYGKKMGMGLMLYGGPGLGKTWLASAIGGETGCYMIIAKQSDIVGQYLGVSQKNVRAIFDQARANSPCIGTKRSEASGSDKHGGGSHIKEIVNELLVQLQGIDKTKDPVFVIVGSNRPWDIDVALRRSGRLEDSLYVNPPNYGERKESIKYYLSKVQHEEIINFGRISRATIGFSHADIAKLMDELALQSARRHASTNQEQWIATKDILEMAKKMENSLDPWFIDTKKELMGKRKVEKVNGKKIITKEAGALEAEELSLYRDMVRDVLKNSGGTYKLHKKFVKAVAIHLW
jgi:transitional endoplasmic reticulum ATPase